MIFFLFSPVALSGIDGVFENELSDLLHFLAFFGQILLPVAFLLGSMASAILNFKRTKLYDKILYSPAQNSLGNISWQDFEYMVGEYFRRRQFSVEKNKAGADGSADLLATKGMEKYLIQCKHWQAAKVGENVVRELLGVMVGVGATGGFAVTSGEFTKDAIDFAKANNILMLDGKELLNSMRSYAIFESQPEQKKGGKLQKIICVLVGLLFFAVSCSFLYPELTTSIYSILPTSIRGFFPDGQKNHNAGNTQTNMPIKQTEQKYLYEIELFSGGRISTDNVIITDKDVTFKSDRGLIVTLKRAEVKTMRKIKLK